MGNNKAIPKGYMTVGEVAKKMGVTVRTLQYYDEKGLLSPTAESEGGRRLYTDKDMVRLHQILSLKRLGFSLSDIQNHLIRLDTPADVAAALAAQATAIREKIQALSQSLSEIEALQEEVLQMESVDFGKYADIIVNLQMKNEFYWLIKHFDDQTLNQFRSRFDMESGAAVMQATKRLYYDAIQLQKDGVAPESEQGQNLAKEFWQMMMELTGGDMRLLPKLMEVENLAAPNDEWKQNQASANAFIESALDVYLTNLGINPFEAFEQD